MAQEIEVSLPPARSWARWDAAAERLAATRRAHWLAFAGVVGLAFFLNAWGLSANGYGNTYYAAAVRSMSGSWSNFFFGAFDPGGFITVDKPPVFLWFGALTARIFGYSSWTLLLPSAAAGAAGVAILWLTIRRYFGTLAATIAAIATALSPIAVAVNRLNLPEPFLVLFLVSGAAALLYSLDSRRWWFWTILAGVFVGLAFNTKMLAAWIPGPAFALAIVAAYPDVRRMATLRRTGLQLALLGAATLISSVSWMLIVDAWPAGSRPYIGGSDDNSVYNLIVDYNGLGRVEGDQGPGGGGNRGAAPTAGGPNGGFIPNQGAAPNNQGTPGGFTPNGAPGGGAPNGGGFVPNPGAAPNNQATPGGNAPPANGAGGIIAGEAGLWRMFDDANAGQIAWLLPFAILGSVVSLWRWRRQPVPRAAVVLWLGWVLLFGGVFSYAQGIYHSYYTAALVPGVGALTGMTVVAFAGLIKEHRWWLAVAAGLVGVTAFVQLDIANRFPGFQDGAKPLLVLLPVIGLAAAIVSFRWRALPASAGLTLAIAGLLVVPASWAWFEVDTNSMNTTLPQAGPRQGAAGRSFGSEAFDSGTTGLAAWLEDHRDPGTTWDLVTQSAMDASTLIAAFDLSVMPVGGFSGSDPTLTTDDFADLVADGEVRYVLLGGGPGGAIINNVTIPGNGSRGNPQTSPFGQNNRRGNPINPNGVNPNSNNNGVPNRLGNGPTSVGIPGTGIPGANQSAGAGVVMSAVQSACTPVTDSTLPQQYQGVIYDCAGVADRLRG